MLIAPAAFTQIIMACALQNTIGNKRPVKLSIFPNSISDYSDLIEWVKDCFCAKIDSFYRSHKN